MEPGEIPHDNVLIVSVDPMEQIGDSQDMNSYDFIPESDSNDTLEQQLSESQQQKTISDVNTKARCSREQFHSTSKHKYHVFHPSRNSHFRSTLHPNFSQNHTLRFKRKKCHTTHYVQKTRYLSFIFASSQEGYVLTDGSRWHSNVIIHENLWKEDIFETLCFMTDSQCCHTDRHSENDPILLNIIIYISDEDSWRRMFHVIHRYKHRFTCSISLRKVEENYSLEYMNHMEKANYILDSFSKKYEYVK